jgi:hypothetical protein
MAHKIDASFESSFQDIDLGSSPELVVRIGSVVDASRFWVSRVPFGRANITDTSLGKVGDSIDLESRL